MLGAMLRITQFGMLAVVISGLITACAHTPQVRTTNPTEHERNVSDLHFTETLTRDEVLSIWGQPDGHRGSGIDYVEYVLADDRKMWLYFHPDPPHRLNIALLFPADGSKPKTLLMR